MFLRLRRTLPYSQQRWFVDSAEAAKKPETRTRRIDAAAPAAESRTALSNQVPRHGIAFARIEEGLDSE
jgi:hypothetical protein